MKLNLKLPEKVSIFHLRPICLSLWRRIEMWRGLSLCCVTGGSPLTSSQPDSNLQTTIWWKMCNKYPFKYSESLLSTLHCINLELSTWHGLRMTKRELIVFGGQFSSSTRLSILLYMKQLNDQRWNKYNQRRMWLCRREDIFQDSSKPSEMGLRNVDCDGCCWLLGGWRAGD